MRVVITAVSSRPQFTKLMVQVNAMIRHLLDYQVVSALFLFVEHSNAALFEGMAECGDSRVEIIPVEVGSSALRCYLWHYRELPGISARLRADLVHFTHPVPIKRGAFFPPTAFSLQHPPTDDSDSNSAGFNALLECWIRGNHLKLMGETARISEPICQRLGLGRMVSGIPSRKRYPAGQRSNAVVTTG
jgi:hypothetical protein